MTLKTTATIGFTALMTLLVIGAVMARAQVVVQQNADATITNQIKTALISGCQPIVDACTSDCGHPINYGNIPASCQANGVIQASPAHVQDLYIQYAQSLGVTDFNFNTMPSEIRTTLQAQGTVLQPIQEPLTVDITQ